MQTVANLSTDNNPSGTQAAYAAPGAAAPAASAPGATGAAGPATTGNLPAGAAAAGGPTPPGNAIPAPVLVASSMTPPIDLAPEEKHAAVPFGLPTTFGGQEIIAWVGPEVILASDVLPDANRVLQKVLERAPQPPTAEDSSGTKDVHVEVPEKTMKINGLP